MDKDKINLPAKPKATDTNKNNHKRRMIVLNKNFWIILYQVAEVFLILATLIFAIMAYKQADKIFILQNRPNLIITPVKNDSINQLNLLNLGPGVAYDINIQVHFADNIGNIGCDFIKDCVKSMIELETKTEDERYKYLNMGEIGGHNHPNVLPVGTEYGFKTTTLSTEFALTGLFVVIKYKDNLGSPYYSFWDGYTWKQSDGILKKPLPKYEHVANETPAAQFYSILLQCKSNLSVYEQIYFDRIWQEAIFLQENGYGNITGLINKRIKEYN